MFYQGFEVKTIFANFDLYMFKGGVETLALIIVF